MPDICHLLKNFKSAVLSQPAVFPETYIEEHNVGSHNTVHGSFITRLWEYEVSGGLKKRLLHHLRREDIYPSNVDKMNVGAAVRFFFQKRQLL